MRALIERCHGVRCLGSSALNTCYVASGASDLYYEFGIHIWDMAAATFIAKEAGCVVLDTDGSELNILNRRVLVSTTQELADHVIKIIQTVVYESD
ncbi:inositol monophosphatase 2 [Brachionus plicatilis]|uniref:Inositol monophosphatase 2 n=1 Tax=Brachionus plicatilis TaxID=10195 RepID=A0A3M7R0H9_BRAPC|nr:inositol monophosphatase 2 [Brachionus plicatilis]